MVSIEGLERFLYCSSLLERKVAMAYDHISKQIDEKIIKGLLTFIAQDSFKHSDLFRSIAESLTSTLEEVDSKGCIEAWGESWMVAIRSAEDILKKDKITFADLKSLMDNLERIESFTAEEYITIIHARLIELILDKDRRLENVKTILEWIVEDEQRHLKILETIKNLIAKGR